MKYYFCTLFDKNYLSKGLTLYYSLKNHAKSFHLWILCMDSITLNILKKMDLPNVTLINLTSFEDRSLKKIKKGRTIEEYCWTCTPSLPLYILKKHPNIDHIGYLDADVFFYSDPLPIFKDWGSNSILVVPHRFPRYLQYKEKKSGKFNVSMVLFKNDKNAFQCLTWWRDKCIEWCFREYDNGRLGDQLYLNTWPEQFKGVHILQNLGAGLAPWNVMNYKIELRNGNFIIDGGKLIFYHFHGLHLYTNNQYKLSSGYEISSTVKKLIYNPYIDLLSRAGKNIKKANPDFLVKFYEKKSLGETFMEQLFILKLKLLRLINRY